MLIGQEIDSSSESETHSEPSPIHSKYINSRYILKHVLKKLY